MPVDRDSEDRGGVQPLPWWQRLEQTKVTPLVVVGFLLMLAAFAAAAAGVAYVSHHFASATHQRRS